jgi:hypothetical protein
MCNVHNTQYATFYVFVYVRYFVFILMYPIDMYVLTLLVELCVCNLLLWGFKSQSQTYFTTGGLPPFSSSWRQVPWEAHEIFFSAERLQTLCNILSDEKMGLSLMNMLGLSSNVHIAHIAFYWKFFLLHYIQVLCQYRLYKADHAYLTYLMLQRQLSHLNDRKLHHHQI